MYNDKIFKNVHACWVWSLKAFTPTAARVLISSLASKLETWDESQGEATRLICCISPLLFLHKIHVFCYNMYLNILCLSFQIYLFTCIHILLLYLINLRHILFKYLYLYSFAIHI